MESLRGLLAPEETKLEFILVDDASTDRSAEIVLAESKRDSRFSCLTAVGRGKKAALRTGFSATHAEWVAMTDADVKLPRDWLLCLFDDLAPGEILRMAPVYPTSAERSPSHSFFELDQFSMMLSAICEAERGRPGLSNGANMAVRLDFRRSLDESELRPEQPSGDDVFLVEAARRRSRQIPMRMMRSAAVFTEVPISWGAWAKQRIRWASKAPSYPASPIRSLAWTIWLGSLACFGMPLLFGVWGWVYWGIKAMGEAAVLIRGARILGLPEEQQMRWRHILPFAVWIQPVSVIVLSILAIRPGRPYSENRSRSGFERAANQSVEPTRSNGRRDRP